MFVSFVEIKKSIKLIENTPYQYSKTKTKTFLLCFYLRSSYKLSGSELALEGREVLKRDNARRQYLVCGIYLLDSLKKEDTENGFVITINLQESHQS